MNYKKSMALLLILFSIALTSAYEIDQTDASQGPATDFDFITAEQLKTRMAGGDRVTVIDVRNTNSYVASENRITGSIHVKLRRLAYRLSFAPLKDVPRESDVVTYCACSQDEASIRAARILLNAGFKRVHVLKGGWENWLKAKGPVQPRPRA